MTFSDRRRQFRAVLASSACVRPASVFDAISARIAEDIGFEVGALGGSLASLAILGAPDLVVLTLSELAEQVRRITRAGSLPIMIDADHGYGNALNVIRTVKELETAGAAALSIEDTVLPSVFGEAKARVLSLEEGLGKMRAAVSARTDPSLVILGRTSAFALNDTEDGLARMRAYADAGVDALFLAGVKSLDQIKAVRTITDLPLVLGDANYKLGSTDELASHGVRIWIQGHQVAMAAIKAVYDALTAVRQGAPLHQLPNQPSAELIRQLTRGAEYDDAIRRYLS